LNIEKNILLKQTQVHAEKKHGVGK